MKKNWINLDYILKVMNFPIIRGFFSDFSEFLMNFKDFQELKINFSNLKSIFQFIISTHVTWRNLERSTIKSGI